ncbi:MAG TPA: penicillin-binding protein 2 [Actinoplanes sp.]|jgi:cell division protein FtsI (penicillin-binding protein 3)
MTPRADEPPRRGRDPRRGAPRVPRVPDDRDEDRRRLGGIGAARAYTPRGRTVAERLAEGDKRARTTEGDRIPEGEKRTRTTEGDKRTRTAEGDRRTRPAERPRIPRPRMPEPRLLRRPPKKRNTPPPPLAGSTRRLRLSTLAALVAFVAIGIRLVVLQVVESPQDERELLRQRDSRLTSVVLPAARGSILDRTGAVLAQSVEARYIYADPTQIRDAPAVAARLSPLLGVPVSKLTPLISRHKHANGEWSQFEYLARDVDLPTAAKIAAMKIAGIGQGRDEKRDEPGADLASNLIGFTGYDHKGLEGIEARYDSILRGTDGSNVYETGNPDTSGGKLDTPIPGGYHRETPARPGTTVQLTIDRDLEYEVESSLSEHLQQVHAVKGAAVVMDVQTGEVLAQASFPTYNAAEPDGSTAADRADVASNQPYDPGSIHKAITIGAALQEGVITPQSSITVGPALRVGGVLFPDDEPQKTGTKLTIPGVMALSSDVGTIRIADRLGKDKLYAYQQKFGLGKATGEGLPAEASGALLAPDEWSGSAYGSVPIGYSVDTTLIQMVAAYNTIANDGTYVQPHLIKDTIAPDGKVTAGPAPQTHPVLTPEVATELRTILQAPVDVEGATGTRAKVPNYLVAGKTGTASKLVDGQYTSYNSGSFIGMAPADHPRFVIGVYADVPSGSGGQVAAPAFSDMMSTTLWHYQVPPSTTQPPTFKIHP